MKTDPAETSTDLQRGSPSPAVNGSAAKLYTKLAAISVLTGAVLITIALAAIHWILATAWVGIGCFVFAYAAVECKKEAEAEAGSTQPPNEIWMEFFRLICLLPS